MKKSIFTLFNLLLIASIVAVGCDVLETEVDNTPSKVQVQMQIQSAISSTTGTGQLMAGQQLNDFEIQEVRFFVEEMELESVTEDSLDFEVENFIVNLPLDGSPLTITERVIPQGLYDEFELEVERPDDDDIEVNDPDFRDENGSYSVVVKGLYKGEEFTYRSREDFEIEMDLNPPLEITGSESTSLVINIDVNSWFKDSDGMDLDPKDFNNSELIDDNIENSFEGYEEEFDDDDDDDDDDDSDD